MDHRRQSKVEDFEAALDQLFAQFGDSVARLQKLLDIHLSYPANTMTRICKKLSLPKKAALEAIGMFEMAYGGGTATAHDVFMAMQEIPYILKSDHAPESKMLVVDFKRKGESILICQFKRLIYPKAVTAGDASYMIALYRPCEKVMDAAGNVVSEIKAVGYCLPTADNLRYDMRGRWSRSAKHGIQFEVEGFDEVIVPSKEGVISYLCSGQIKGIGPKTAEKIYAMFGQNTLTVLDHEPEQLLAVSGISKTKLKKICDSYLASRGARDVVAFLAPHGVTPNRAVKLYKQYGEQTMDIVRNHPYRLCEMVGVGFKTADRIAISMGFDPLSPERVDEGLIFTLTDAELKRHLCMEKHSFLKQCLKLLDTEGLTEEMLAVRASRMLESGRLASYDRQVYRAVTARTEQSLAWAVYRMLTYEKAESHVNIDTEISAEEKKQGIQLASEQRHAVTTALTSQLSVITGGPGTGKTLIQRFLLDIYRRKNRGAKIICCAPTGRAARRMEQSTGFPATTIHKALGLLAGEDGDYCEPEMLDADLIVVDEVSMMDWASIPAIRKKQLQCALPVL